MTSLLQRVQHKLADERRPGALGAAAVVRGLVRSLRWRATLLQQRLERTPAVTRVQRSRHRLETRRRMPSAASYAALARAERDLGDVEAAYRAWGRAAELDPDELTTYGQHAYELWQRGWWDDALSLWERRVHAQRRLARKQELDRFPLRVLGREWTGVVGMIACLDTYVKQQLLAGRPLEQTLVLGNPVNVSNPCLLDYWREHLPTTIVSRAGYSRFAGIAELLGTSFFVWPDDDGDLHSYFEIGGSVQRRWDAESRPPLLTLRDDDRARGRAELERLGVPPDAWFVTLHVREAGYHDVRNADVAGYAQAIDAVVERGGWVIRMGDTSMTPLAPRPHVVDYAFSDAKSDWMDVFLWADCRFLLGTQSGPFQVPGSFGVPVVQTNWGPPATRYWFAHDLVIPKLYRSSREGRLLTHAESLRPPVGFCHLSDHLASLGIRAVDNTPEEIRDVVIEMLDRVEGRAIYTAEDEERQRRVDAMQAPVRYPVPSGGSRYGRDFLRAHAELFDAAA